MNQFLTIFTFYFHCDKEEVSAQSFQLCRKRVKRGFRSAIALTLLQEGNKQESVCICLISRTVVNEWCSLQFLFLKFQGEKGRAQCIVC